MCMDHQAKFGDDLKRPFLKMRECLNERRGERRGEGQRGKENEKRRREEKEKRRKSPFGGKQHHGLGNDPCVKSKSENYPAPEKGE